MTFEIELLKTPHKFERIDSEAGRQYLIDKKYIFPSVTTVLQDYGDKKGLKEWAQRVGELEANAQKKRATNRGTALHKVVENYLHGRLDVDEMRAQNPILYQLFKSIVPLLDRISIVHGIECPVFSPDLQVAGTVDNMSVYDGIDSIIDFKTAKQQKTEEQIDNYFLQETIYTVCAKHTYNYDAKQIVTIIAVEHDQPQLFIKNRDAYLKRAFEAIIQYKKLNKAA